MRGFETEEGFMGMVDGEYMLFSTQDEYWEYLED